MSYQSVMAMPYGVFIGMANSISILQAQEQILAFNAASYGNPNLKQSARTKLHKETMKQADSSKFVDDDKKQVTMREMAEILRQARG